MALRFASIPNLDSCEPLYITDFNYSYSERQGQPPANLPFVEGTNLFSLPTQTIYTDENTLITVETTVDSTSTTTVFSIKYLGEILVYLSRSENNGSFFGIVPAIDDSTQEAVLFECREALRGASSTDVYVTPQTTSSYRRALYNCLMSIVPSSHSGGAGSGYIGNSLVSNKKMVGYNVPTSEAESTKTESVEDASESPVSGKPKIGNGYAKITFLHSCWGGEEVAILWAGNSNKMTVQISNNDILFKLYTGDTAIYSFTAYAGSTILDADNIYVHFLIESEQHLAKPSMVYANGSVLSYNQEEPTDEEMADIYTWLSAGLPSA